MVKKAQITSATTPTASVEPAHPKRTRKSTLAAAPTKPTFEMQALPAPIDQEAREQAIKAAADALFAEAERLKDANGSALGYGGSGDAGVTERRNAIEILASARGKYSQRDRITAMGKPFVDDLATLEQIDSDAPVDMLNLSWAKEIYNPNWGSSDGTEAVIKAFGEHAQGAVSHLLRAAMDRGTFFDATNGSLMPLVWTNDWNVRRDVLLDALLRYRTQPKGADDTYRRIDNDGVVCSTEQKWILGKLALPEGGCDVSTPAWRDFALLRLALAAHPVSGMNAIFRARNLVAAMMRMTRTEKIDSDSSWVKAQIPAGAHASPYMAIHRNFSADTPKDIEAFLRELVFPLGPRDERVPTFLALASALGAAAQNDIKRARADLNALATSTHEPSVKDLVAKLATTDDQDLAEDLNSFLLRAMPSSLKRPDAPSEFFADAAALYGCVCGEAPSARRFGNELLRAGDAVETVASVMLRLGATEGKLALAREVASSQAGIQESLDDLANALARLQNGLHGGLQDSTVEALAKSLAEVTGTLSQEKSAITQSAAAIEAEAWQSRVATLCDLAAAHEDIQSAFWQSPSGRVRRDLLSVDGLIDRAALEALGNSVNAVGDCETALQRTEALIGVSVALRLVLASGLPALRDFDDPVSDVGPSIKEIRDEITALLPQPGLPKTVSQEAYRRVMAKVEVLASRIQENIAALCRPRQKAASNADFQYDPEFLDQLMKQTPLHYAVALAQKARFAGLEEEITERSIKNLRGLRVLNSVGPVVFPKVHFVDGLKDLIDLQVPSTDLAVINHLDEKQRTAVAVGGMALKTADAPGGSSHLNIFAISAGMDVLAFPDLQRHRAFFERANAEGGIYFNDQDGQLTLMTVDLAAEQGLVDKTKLCELMPGANRDIYYLRPDKVGDAFKVFQEHHHQISPLRKTRTIELFIPPDDLGGIGSKVMTAAELANLDVPLGRAIAGEKGMVLAQLAQHPDIGLHVPPTSHVCVPLVKTMLQDAGVLEAWRNAFASDDGDVFKSAFYADPNKRMATRAQLYGFVEDKLEEYLFSGGELTDAGVALYDQIIANAELKDSDRLVVRSSFTCEDRPYKSGAGQYESFCVDNCPSDVVRAVAGVIVSFWKKEPIDNNIKDDIDLRYVWPAITIQRAVENDGYTKSGVFTSRGRPQNERGVVTADVVEGLGSGVDGAKAERGLIRMSGYELQDPLPGRSTPLLSQSRMNNIRSLVLKTEEFFNAKIEPGRDFAIESEAIYADGDWYVVQARTIIL